LQWLEHRQYAPALRALKAKLTAQQSSEIKTQEKKAVLKPKAVSVSDQMIQKITGQLANYLKENPSKATTTLDVIQEVFQLDIKAHE